MAVIFDFEAGKGFHFTSAFAKRFECQATGDRVLLPALLGEGFIQEVYPDNGLSLCLHQYQLRQDLILRRHGTGATEVLTLKFDGRRRMPVRSLEDAREPLFSTGKGCEVEFGTSNFFTEVRIPAYEEINFVVIVTSRRTLLNLLQIGEGGLRVQGAGEGGLREGVTRGGGSRAEGSGVGRSDMAHIIRDNPSFFLHEAMTREMEKTLKQLSQINETTPLPSLLYQTRAQELIYYLFTRLLSRKTGIALSIDQEDVNKIYQVRASILADLSAPPKLSDLARHIGMSSTKMKQLFRQIFGDSIYNYFQVERMNEAAQLLRDFSVSQVGYRIGFSNLSHFTRLFEKHHQMKPKRYKDTLEEDLATLHS
jgi:AraC-like DNA-binding protein